MVTGEWQYNGSVAKLELGSLKDLSTYTSALPNVGDLRTDDQNWYGGSWDAAHDLAAHGWDEELPDALGIAQTALELIEKTHEMPAWHAFYDVTGSIVDVPRMLSGEPECMIDFVSRPISKVGRVVTLCASVTYSAALSIESVKRRGYAIAALALALDKTGHAVELWADRTCEVKKPYKACTRVLIKGANDLFDPAKVMFAYSHPSMLRRLMLAAPYGMASDFRRKSGIPSGSTLPINPVEDLPEGTIYVPTLRSANDIPDPDRFVTSKLRELGLITD